MAVEETGGAVAMTVHGGKVLLADVFTALGSLLLLAILQNTDVICSGSKMHTSTPGAYAAISVPAKALVFVALVLVNYLLPEAAIRHQARLARPAPAGAHLRRVGHPLCSVLLGHGRGRGPPACWASSSAHQLTDGAPAFSTLVLAMIFMSVTVVLAIYLLGIGWRWVVVVLALGCGRPGRRHGRGRRPVPRHGPGRSRRAGGVVRGHDGVLRGRAPQQRRRRALADGMRRRRHRSL